MIGDRLSESSPITDYCLPITDYCLPITERRHDDNKNNNLQVIPKSRRALEATEFAREQGKHDAFHSVVWRRFYGEGQDLSSWEMLHAAAVEVGLDAGMMQEKVEGGAYTAVIDWKVNSNR